jgi:hypothetical protein
MRIVAIGSGWRSGLRSSGDRHRDKRLGTKPTRWGEILGVHLMIL